LATEIHRKSTDENGSLRDGWRRVAFGDVVRDINASEKSPLDAGLSRYIGLEHIEPNNLHIGAWGDLAEDEVSFTKTFREGQVLFGKRRAYQRKVAVAEFDGICSSDILTFESKTDQLAQTLLPFIVQSSRFFDHALDTSSGSLSPRTRWSQLKTFQFALPPAEQQERIADVLWAADTAEVEYQKCSARIDELREVLLDDIVSNHLSQFPSRPVGETLDSDRRLCYGVIQPGKVTDTGVPFIRVCDMETGSITVEQLERVSDEVHEKYRRSVIQSGDVLVSVVGTIGRCLVVPDACNGFNIARAVARLSPSCEVDSFYLRSVLLSKQMQERLVGGSVETARKTLNLKALGELVIPVPPIATQRSSMLPIAKLESSRHQFELHAEQIRELRAQLVDQLVSGDWPDV